ncbi:uncharacterized protein [Clytia hemisphaerica]
MLLCLYIHATHSQKPYVERKASRSNYLTQPTLATNLFKNEGTLCFFTNCMRRKARCSGFSCCWCKCKTGLTFYSQKKGCLSGSGIGSQNDEQCMFYSSSMKNREDVPLFTTSQQNHQVGLNLMDDFPINENMTCTAGYVHYMAYQTGEKKLLHHNWCQEVIKIHINSNNKIAFRFGHNATDYWSSMEGQLLSVEVHCSAKDESDFYSSCFTFQVAGKSSNVLLPSIPFPPENHTCPAVDDDIDDDGGLMPTDGPSSTMVAVEGSVKGETNIGMIVGIAVVVVLVVCVSIFVVFFLRHRKLKQNSEVQNANLIYDRPEVRTNTYEDAKLYKKKKRNSSTNSLKKPGQDLSVLYVDVPDADEYSAIDDDDHQYETPVKVIDTLTREGTLGRNGTLSRNGTLGRDGRASWNGNQEWNGTLGRNGTLSRDSGNFSRNGTLGRNGCIECQCGGTLGRDGTLGRGGVNMSQRPLPERPPEQNNEYYEPAEAGVQIKQSEDNELYSLYSSITNLNPE